MKKLILANHDSPSWRMGMRMAAGYYRYTTPGTMVMLGIGALLGMLYLSIAIIGWMYEGVFMIPIRDPEGISMAIAGTALFSHGMIPGLFFLYGLILGEPNF